ncbi:MAG: hypothetical protein FWF96_02675 [Kiritimatiellaeota bacterium]|nr:hypothetical protein [Kiritimatiellota bacterium]
MTSKQRVLRTFLRQETDRPPVNYFANGGIDRRLKAHYGLAPDDSGGLQKILGVDFRTVNARYAGPKLHADIPERGVIVDDWGIHRRWIEHPTGGYWDYCDFPLANAGVEDVRKWRMPSPDDFDYSHIAAECERHRDHAVVLGHAGNADIINSAGQVRTMEQVLVDLMLDVEAGLLYIDRRIEVTLEVMRRSFEAAKGAIDIMWMGEDLGTQIAPLISLDLYRRQLRPRHQPFIDLAKKHGARVMLHSCGSSSWAYNDFIEMGVDGVDTLQPEAANMAPAYLKKTYGPKLVLHGCISTAGPVATGTAEDTRRYCRDMLGILAPGGGYCFSPTHSLQDNSPVENVVAMYETVLGKD